jgi:hypothetical protein
LEDLNVDEKVLKCITEEQDVDQIQLRQGLMVGSCGCGKNALGPINLAGF